MKFLINWKIKHLEKISKIKYLIISEEQKLSINKKAKNFKVFILLIKIYRYDGKICKLKCTNYFRLSKKKSKDIKINQNCINFKFCSLSFKLRNGES